MKKKTLVVGVVGVAITMVYAGGASAGGKFASRPADWPQLVSVGTKHEGIEPVISSAPTNGFQPPIMTDKPVTVIEPVFVAQPAGLDPGPTVGPASNPDPITPGLTTGPSSGTTTDDEISESVPSDEIGVGTPAGDGVNESVPSDEIGVVTPTPGGDDVPPADDGDQDDQGTEDTAYAPPANDGETAPEAPVGVVPPSGGQTEEGSVATREDPDTVVSGAIDAGHQVVIAPEDGGNAPDHRVVGGNPGEVLPILMSQGGGCSLVR